MGYYCTVPQCTSLAGKTKNVKFHRFPRDVTMADKWNVILRRGKPYTKYSKVCSLHFTQADYNVTTMGQWKTLSKDAVPSQNLPKLNPDGSVMIIRKSRTIKYRDGQIKKEDGEVKLPQDKWPQTSALLNGTLNSSASSVNDSVTHSAPQDSILAYRLQSLNNLANTLTQTQNTANHTADDTVTPIKPEKQDAIMQTDPLSEEENENHINTSYSDNSEHSFHSEHNMEPFNNVQTSNQEYESQIAARNQLGQTRNQLGQTRNQLEQTQNQLGQTRNQLGQTQNQLGQTQNQIPPPHSQDNYEIPKDYTKTNEGYTGLQSNKTAADGYEKGPGYQKPMESENGYQKVIQNGYQKLPEDMYGQEYSRDYQDKQQEYQSRSNSYMSYQNGYTSTDSVEILRNQQHNLQMLQEQQHRLSDNQNFFNESHIKQEIDLSNEDDTYMYERTKEMESVDAYSMEQRRMLHQQRVLEQLQHQVKVEPDPLGPVCEGVMQPQDSPYFQSNGHNNLPGVSVGGGGVYYETLSRPGPELLIAKQNALAAHTQLWQNTMKRPFFYSESPHYTGSQLLHRYEDLTRILQ